MKIEIEKWVSFLTFFVHFLPGSCYIVLRPWKLLLNIPWIREWVHRSQQSALFVIKLGRIMERGKLNHIKLYWVIWHHQDGSNDVINGDGIINSKDFNWDHNNGYIAMQKRYQHKHYSYQRTFPTQVHGVWLEIGCIPRFLSQQFPRATKWNRQALDPRMM